VNEVIFIFLLGNFLVCLRAYFKSRAANGESNVAIFGLKLNEEGMLCVAKPKF